MSARGATTARSLACAVGLAARLAVAGVAAAQAPPAAPAGFESPPAEPPAASLSPQQVTGENFHVEDPVASDGLMHHYVLVSRFGSFPAYGHDALVVRLHEVAALTSIERTSATDVVFKSVSRGLQEDVKAVFQLARNPFRVVLGIPTGIGHLLSGYKAQAQEASAQARKALAPADGSGSAGGASAAASKVRAEASDYARRYLGITAAERRWYRHLDVDPYTDNQVLRNAVKRLARLDAAASFGMRFTPVGAIPYAADVRRALDAIYNEDPAVLRQRSRATLAGFGLTAAEIERFENTPLLSPTRQSLLREAAQSLAQVEGRDELFRHAMSVTTEEEVDVFLNSTRLLVRAHARHPVVRILAGVRVPAARTADGRVQVFGTFDSVYWTAEVADYERALREALPADAAARELWLTGVVSARARQELEQRGWRVQAQADAALAADSPP